VRGLVSDDGAVALKRADGEDFVDHEGSVVGRQSLAKHCIVSTNDSRMNHQRLTSATQEPRAQPASQVET
jgi:hypothetical protein